MSKLLQAEFESTVKIATDNVFQAQEQIRSPFKFGTLKFTISEDFDEPLQDFEEYM